MAYQAKTFNWREPINAIVEVAKEITGLPVVAENQANDQKDYPFIVFTMVTPRASITSSNTKTNELFNTTFQFDCYAKSEGEALSISDDLATLFSDVKYHEELKKSGVIVNRDSATDTSIQNQELTSFMPISVAGFDLKVQLHRTYSSDYPTLNEFNLGKGSVQ
ncbi:hypothetical protein IWT140_01708 [Secundilactobacillus pentosiphilus]|uniref:Phage neck terminator protein gp12-like domain-containing protein n=1 Tax=Secundilactobacillus pentosiphilus TaxID=1714682 RepID=A0A1Z5IRL7_9LACO|nr:hypothetical protein [Secundilactobacillus pentosiphilus]GAX04071.1 hypothetical protein IWT140_01708 [Secundilactobacillus pentosiphilus]